MSKLLSVLYYNSNVKQIIGLLISFVLAWCINNTSAQAAFAGQETYYWVHVPNGGAPVFSGDTQGPFVKDEYPIAREASARVLKVERTDLKSLERQLEQNNLSESVIDVLLGKTGDFKWLGLSGGLTLVYHEIPEPRYLKPVQTEYVCLFGGQNPQVIFGLKVLGQLGAEEYNEGASGLTKDPLIVLGQQYFPASSSGKVTEFWVYSNTTCLNVDTNNS